MSDCHTSEAKSNANEGDKLKWWQLSMIGVGCIIGTGFFLGSSLAIKMTGPSVVIAFLLAATGTYLVFDALGKLSADDPQKGSFRSYAKKAFGSWAGFSSGWIYWGSELLIMGSQLTALSIFARFWFPNVPMWVFASCFAVLGLLVVLSGTKGFERLEDIFAVIKVAAIIMFLVIAFLAIFGVIKGDGAATRIPGTFGEFMPKGLMGLWSALIFAFYAFGGIEIMGIMATRLRHKEDASKAGKVMLLVLTTIYLLSISLAVLMVSWHAFNTKESPFVIALEKYHLPFVPHAFNGAMIIAGFSTMCASLFAVTSMVVTLAKDGDAPRFLANKGKLKVPHFALALTAAGLVAAVILALVMPETLFEYLTTAAGLMLLYNWFFILISYNRLLKLKNFDHIKRFTGMALIALAVSGTLLHNDSRPGFFISLLFIGVIGLVLIVRHFMGKRKKKLDVQEA
ncbi:amino acid permease [Bacillus sp. T33-2]|uniref:amino acid permease n=1 Tax=Bacillus sp. T33-2 TaxID=2054168 RepID=UPI000C7807DC|nr:amino acid permease [Bacillus sp. T33-2]PLR98830.1 amino acid permease [Bacillus sp. T33-2]